MRGLLKPSSVQAHFVIGGLLCRSLSTSNFRWAVDKGLLSRLRKQTGIPFINCKKALEKFDNDFDQAKQWLQEQAQKEGWARATKLQARPMSQGLVALMASSTRATLLEVNCETDFVARNEKFVEMVGKLIQECDRAMANESRKRINLTKEELCAMRTVKDTSLADIIALNVGNLGENMALRRAASLRASSDDSVLCSYIHPSNSGKLDGGHQLGKYGAVVELCRIQQQQPSSTTSSSSSSATAVAVDLQKLGSHLCQHIVGMNPKSIGEFSPLEQKLKDPHHQQQERQSDVSSNNNNNNEGNVSEGEKATTTQQQQEEEVDDLLSQEFLLDSSVTVGEMLHSYGVEVKDFVRFGCGEKGRDGEK